MCYVSFDLRSSGSVCYFCARELFRHLITVVVVKLVVHTMPSRVALPVDSASLCSLVVFRCEVRRYNWLLCAVDARYTYFFKAVIITGIFYLQS